MFEFMGERLRDAVKYAMQAEDSDTQDSLDSDEDEAENDTPEVTGATALLQSSNSFPRRRANHVKRPPKAKKRRKRKQKN